MKPLSILGGFLIALAVALPTTALATTYVVRPDGSGDFATIQAAVNAAVAGDVVELANGTFTGPGNREIAVPNIQMTIRSQSGDPDLCVIDCEDAGQGIVFDFPPAGTALQGITITRGHGERGAGLCIQYALEVTISDCVFYRNRADVFGGGAYARGRLTFTRCRFIENVAQAGGAFCEGGTTGDDVNPTLTECQFIRNTADYAGAALYLETAPIRDGGERDATIRSCVFAENSVSSGRGTIVLLGLSPTLEHCTFADNAVPGGAVVECLFSILFPSDPTFTNCIFAFSAGGAPVACDANSSANLTCCDLYGNEGGDWVGCVEDQAESNGNFTADPIFCDRESGDYALQSTSPCAPGNNPQCGQVGALPVGCGGVPVQVLSWGKVKSMYR